MHSCIFAVCTGLCFPCLSSDEAVSFLKAATRCTVSTQLAFVEGRNGAKHPGFLLELHSHRDPWDFPGSLFPYSQNGLFLRSPLVSQILKMFKLNNCHISNFKPLQGIGLPVKLNVGKWQWLVFASFFETYLFQDLSS